MTTHSPGGPTGAAVLEGLDSIGQREQGTRELLDNLEAELRRSPTPNR